MAITCLGKTKTKGLQQRHCWQAYSWLTNSIKSIIPQESLESHLTSKLSNKEKAYTNIWVSLTLESLVAEFVVEALFFTLALFLLTLRANNANRIITTTIAANAQTTLIIIIITPTSHIYKKITFKPRSTLLNGAFGALWVHYSKSSLPIVHNFTTNMKLNLISVMLVLNWYRNIESLIVYKYWKFKLKTT